MTASCLFAPAIGKEDSENLACARVFFRVWFALWEQRKQGKEFESRSQGSEFPPSQARNDRMREQNANSLAAKETPACWPYFISERGRLGEFKIYFLECEWVEGLFRQGVS